MAGIDDVNTGIVVWCVRACDWNIHYTQFDDSFAKVNTPTTHGKNADFIKEITN